MAVAKKHPSTTLTPFCPYHDSTVAWWWQKKCSVCAEVYRIRNDEISSDLKNHQARHFADVLNAKASKDEPVASSGHPDHRFLRYPIVTAYTARRDRMPPEEALLEETAKVKTSEEKRMARRAKACEKFPYTLARKGTDTNVDTFTGKTLMLKRSALDVLGRKFTGVGGDKVAWH